MMSHYGQFNFAQIKKQVIIENYENCRLMNIIIFNKWI